MIMASYFLRHSDLHIGFFEFEQELEKFNAVEPPVSS